MVMEIKLVSEDQIRPSSPTPPHLKTHKFSFLDQDVAPIYVPLVIFYTTNQVPTTCMAEIVAPKRSEILRQSLSETLSYFYPLAGRSKDNLFIDCNDEGVHFAEAKVNLSLHEIKEKLDPDMASKFLPGFAWSEADPGTHLTKIQVTDFACGGFSIGVLVSHMIADAAALSVFLKFWAATAKKSGGDQIGLPIFDASILFPQDDSCPSGNTMDFIRPFIKTGRSATKRLVFDDSFIASLKEKAIRRRDPSVPNPTRVEVVSAHLCNCILSGSQKQLLVTHAVNLRRRAKPPLPECSMGNLVVLAPAFLGGDRTLSDGLISQVRKAISKIDGEFVKSIQGVEGKVRLREAMKEFERDLVNDVEFIAFSSWCNMGHYEIDFGWGKPFWVTTCGDSDRTTFSVNRIYLMDRPSGEGIEACVCLSQEDMALL